MPARRNPPLSLDEIVDTALTLTAADGLAAVGMRTVSALLGVTPMALYHHVGDKDALVGLVADAVVAGVPAPPDDLAWDAWMTAYHDALWSHVNMFHGVARFLLEHPSTPAGADIRRRTVDLLVRSGFTEREALLASSTFHTHLLGRLALSTQVGHDRRGHEPRWNAHGLGAADYERHGLETIVAGLRSLHDTVNP